MSRIRSISFMMSLLLVLSLCSVSFAAHTNFRANLNGRQEVPAVTTTATGTAALTLTPAGGLTYLITVNGLSGPITAAHFHLGFAGVSGPVVRDIMSSFAGNTAKGTWKSTDTPALVDSIIAAFLAGKIYINIHTAANPNGEIRGQVLLSSGTAFSATLEGTQEVPSVLTSAIGTAQLTLTSVGSVGLAYTLTVNGLSGPITGAHFHLAPIGASGAIVREITGEFSGNTATGLWRTGTGPGALVDSLIIALLDGRMYLNVHTAANPAGEIRGQVLVSAGLGMTASLDGAQEVPAVTTPAKGTASMTLTEYGLVYALTVDSLSGPVMAAHFHNAATGVAGPVVRTITMTGNHATGIWKSNDSEPLSGTLLRELLAGNIYINVHTAANPGGEIRGQVLLKVGSGASARFDGLQEAPRVITNAKATASLTATSTGVAYEITATGLSGPIAAAHFHMAGIGIAGGVVRDIMATFTGTTASGTWGTTDATQPFTEELRAALVAGKLYLNLHTAANPGGEIRGQVLVDAGAGFRSRFDGNQENPPLTNSATGSGSFTLTRGGLGFNITIDGLSGPIMGAHFHLGAPGQNGPVMKDIMASVNGNNAVGYWRTVGTQPLVDSLLVALLTGNIYVNFHTATNPGGEIRGQVYPAEGTGFTVALDGGQEVPAVTTDATGTAFVAVTDAGASFFATVDGLSGAIAAAHFHNAAAGVNGPVVRTIAPEFKGGNTAAGLWRSIDAEPLSNQLLREIFANNTYLNVHTAANPGGEIRGQVKAGAIVITSVAERNFGLPQAFRLAQNYPNPFNPETSIRYELPQNARVQLIIYNVLGVKVRTLVDAFETAGVKQVSWDGKDEAGQRVASGVYLYRLEAGDFKSMRKLTLMK